MFRAINARKYKAWRPQIFRNSKDDYNLLESEDEEYLLPPMDDLFSEIRSRFCAGRNSEIMSEATVRSSIDTGIKSLPVVDEQEEILKILQDINTRIDASFENIKRCFRWICFESNPQYFHVCRSCGRYIGCFSSAKTLVHCPQCRQDLFLIKCTSCEGRLQLTKKPYFIPDLAKSIGMPEMSKPDQEDDQATDEV